MHLILDKDNLLVKISKMSLMKYRVLKKAHKQYKERKSIVSEQIIVIML